MASALDEPVFGTFRFIDPDLSVSAEERAIFAGPAPTEVKEESLQLHDFRTSADIVQGVKGLDVQAFTYIHHKSALTGHEIMSGTNAEDVYGPEVLDFMLKLTGASHGVLHNIAFRRKFSTQTDLYKVQYRGNEVDQAIAQLPKDKLLVNGREDDSQEPARHAHCDMVLESLRDTLHFCRRDISEAGKRAWEAERFRQQDASVKVPRYAAYSVWRPLKTVKRDPIAVLDYRSVDKSELVEAGNRIPSEMTKSGDYIVKAWVHKPPMNPGALRWYFVPEQTPEEVLIIKFCDSATAEDDSIAAGCIHCSPVIPGTENEEARCSVETRVYLFWE